MPELAADIWGARARVLLAGGRRTEAASALRHAAGEYERLGVVISANRARSALSGLARGRPCPVDGG